MNRFLRPRMMHYLVWAGGITLLLVLRPRPWSPIFLAGYGAVIVLGVFLEWQSHLETAAAKRVYAGWEARIKLLAPTIDVEDDGHLFEWLDPPQWEAVFHELEMMPNASRRLRQAMKIIAPEACE